MWFDFVSSFHQWFGCLFFLLGTFWQHTYADPSNILIYIALNHNTSSTLWCSGLFVEDIFSIWISWNFNWISPSKYIVSSTKLSLTIIMISRWGLHAKRLIYIKSLSPQVVPGNRIVCHWIKITPDWAEFWVKKHFSKEQYLLDFLRLLRILWGCALQHLPAEYWLAII